jgi:hypothetical protein
MFYFCVLAYYSNDIKYIEHTYNCTSVSVDGVMARYGTSILSRDGVTIDGFWIHNWIY